MDLFMLFASAYINQVFKTFPYDGPVNDILKLFELDKCYFYLDELDKCYFTAPCRMVM